MNMPLVSIITVTKNSQAYLEESILSVINQSYKKIEYIIVDGLSTDGTIEIIKKYSNHISCWVSEPDNSMYCAINKALNLANGDLIAILNSDDRYYDNQVIEMMVRFIQKSNTDGTYGDLVIDYGDCSKYRKVFKVDYKDYLFFGKGTLVPHITLFIKKECMNLIGFYNENYKYASDYDFILRALKKCNFSYIPYPIAVFRRHNQSITASGKIRSERIRIIEDNNYKKYPIIERHATRIWLWLKYYYLNVIQSNKNSI